MATAVRSSFESSPLASGSGQRTTTLLLSKTSASEQELCLRKSSFSVKYPRHGPRSSGTCLQGLPVCMVGAPGIMRAVLVLINPSKPLEEKVYPRPPVLFAGKLSRAGNG